MMMHLHMLWLTAAAAFASGAADARTLEAIQARGALSVCAHANALPFASRAESPPGPQNAIARPPGREPGGELEIAGGTNRTRPAAQDSGTRGSDAALRQKIDLRLARLLADGTIRDIYARYGVEHRAPTP